MGCAAICWQSTNDRGRSACAPTGTTGDPKGVVHSHSALLANVGAALRNLPLQPDEVHFAFLPMAHIMEQFIEALVIAVGGAIGYWTQNIRALSVCGQASKQASTRHDSHSRSPEHANRTTFKHYDPPCSSACREC